MTDDEVDPDLRRCQDMMIEAFSRLPTFDSTSMTELRQACAVVRAPWTEGGPTMKRTEEHHVGEYSTRIRIYHPDGSQVFPALLYIHGGGWSIFGLDTHDRLMREYAGRANIVVVGVDYSLSPEAKFPRAIDEIVSVVQWLRKQDPTELGIDPQRIAIGGDSAGANLSVVTNLRLRALNERVLIAQLLSYGVYDHIPPEFNSYVLYDGPKYRLNVEETHLFWTNYVRDERDFADPLVCPLRGDLRGLPPSFLCIAECDILADENRAMAQALRDANVSVEERVYRGATHSFLEAVRIAAISHRALDEASQWLVQQLDSNLKKSS